MNHAEETFFYLKGVSFNSLAEIIAIRKMDKLFTEEDFLALMPQSKWIETESVDSHLRIWQETIPFTPYQVWERYGKRPKEMKAILQTIGPEPLMHAPSTFECSAIILDNDECPKDKKSVLPWLRNLDLGDENEPDETIITIYVTEGNDIQEKCNVAFANLKHGPINEWWFLNAKKDDLDDPLGLAIERFTGLKRSQNESISFVVSESLEFPQSTWLGGLILTQVPPNHFICKFPMEEVLIYSDDKLSRMPYRIYPYIKDQQSILVEDKEANKLDFRFRQKGTWIDFGFQGGFLTHPDYGMAYIDQGTYFCQPIINYNPFRRK